jgi:hypothetical protein
MRIRNLLALLPISELITVLLPSVSAAETPAEFDALLRVGVPCARPEAGPAWGLTSAEAPVRRIAAPTLTRSTDDDLAILRWKDVSFSSLSDDFRLLVEEGTVGLVIRAQARNDRFRISVELADPSGTLVACEDCADTPAVGEINAGRGTTQMPSTDRPGWELTPGLYTFRVRATPDLPELDPGAEDVTVDITATLRADAAVEVRRFLDLNFI